MNNCHSDLCSAPHEGHHGLVRHSLMNTLNNFICFFFAAAAFAMIGIEAGNQASVTHSGTQEVVRHD